MIAFGATDIQRLGAVGHSQHIEIPADSALSWRWRTSSTTGSRNIDTSYPVKRRTGLQ
jgi:hypothetical protein